MTASYKKIDYTSWYLTTTSTNALLKLLQRTRKANAGRVDVCLAYGVPLTITAEQLKAELSKREHIPNKAERAQLRREQAKEKRNRAQRRAQRRCRR